MFFMIYLHSALPLLYGRSSANRVKSSFQTIGYIVIKAEFALDLRRGPPVDKERVKSTLSEESHKAVAGRQVKDIGAVYQ